MVRSIGVRGFNRTARTSHRRLHAHECAPVRLLFNFFPPLVSEPPSHLYRPFFRLTTFSQDHKRARKFEIYSSPGKRIILRSLCVTGRASVIAIYELLFESAKSNKGIVPKSGRAARNEC